MARKKLEYKDKKVIFTISLDPSKKTKLKKMATCTNKTITYLIREAIEIYIKEYEV